MDKTAASQRSNLAEGLAGNECAKREPSWDECPLEVKVERLRVVLQRTVANAERAEGLAIRGLGIAMQHEHGGDHKPVMPIGRDGWNEAGNRLAGDYRPARSNLLD